jgi:hypothetical protein
LEKIAYIDCGECPVPNDVVACALLAATDLISERPRQAILLYALENKERYER